MIGIEDVRAAAECLRGVANRTPVLTSRTLDERLGAQVFIKAESFQRTGSFKFRGAFNAVSSLTPEQRAAGIVSLSSGNYAQALALAAQLAGARATILMPSDGPATKREATRGYGAEIVPFDRYAHDFDELMERTAQERGLTAVHPFDDWPVMAGQGTTAIELLEEAGDLDVLVVCCGGGGLLAGCATAATAICPSIRLFGVEPEASDDHVRSLAEGTRVAVEVTPTIADGQMLPMPGRNTFEVNRRLVEGFVAVSDDEIRDAMRFLFERMKVVAEPSGASALAALLAGRIAVGGKRVGVTISGGNIGTERFAEVLGL